MAITGGANLNSVPSPQKQTLSFIASALPCS